jgi:hypothetical protein
MKSIVLTILALIASVCLAFNVASAFSQADLHKLKTTGNCVNCDLSGAVLIHWNYLALIYPVRISQVLTSPMPTWQARTCRG